MCCDFPWLWKCICGIGWFGFYVCVNVAAFINGIARLQSLLGVVLYMMMEAHRSGTLLLTSLHNVHHFQRARNTQICMIKNAQISAHCLCNVPFLCLYLIPETLEIFYLCDDNNMVLFVYAIVIT